MIFTNTVRILFSLLIAISLLSISKTDLSLIFIVCIKNYDRSIQVPYLIILKITLKNFIIYLMPNIKNF